VPLGTECFSEGLTGQEITEKALSSEAPKAVGGKLVPGIYVLSGEVTYGKANGPAEREVVRKGNAVLTKEGAGFRLDIVESLRRCPEVRRIGKLDLRHCTRQAAEEATEAIRWRGADRSQSSADALDARA
jgi:hypothetical protein